MIFLDNFTTDKVLRAIDKMQGLDSLDLPLNDHPLLRLERMQSVQTETAPGYILNIGTLHRTNPPVYEVRMMMIVVDQRDSQTKRGSVTVFPVSYYDDVNEVVETAVSLADGRVQKFNTTIQKSLANFAHAWLAELDTAGYF